MCRFVITAVALHYRSVMFSNNRFPFRFEPFLWLWAGGDKGCGEGWEEGRGRGGQSFSTFSLLMMSRPWGGSFVQAIRRVCETCESAIMGGVSVCGSVCARVHI